MPRTQACVWTSIFPVFAVLAFLPGIAGAQPLTLSVTPASVSGAAGASVVFDGTITNDTGTTLNASDLFLNFYGFDPLTLTSVNQLLGTSNFTLANNATSPIVDLFGVQIAQNAIPGSYPLDVSVQDINNNLSNTAAVSVDVSATTAIPEPSAGLLLITGLITTGIWTFILRSHRA